jgi:translation initiation factor 1
VKDDRLVYSTDSGRVGARPARDRGAAANSVVPDDGVVRIFRERGGRRGKTVTVIRGLPERGSKLETLAAELRRLCGAGGTVRDGAVEIQGDHRERVAERLRGFGHSVKLARG